MKSKYFSINELTFSRTAQKEGIENIPSDAIKSNLEFLAVKLLDPIREFLQRPVKINSAYRSKELNSKVGGTTNSIHTMGLAADLLVSSEEEQDRLLQFLKNSEIVFDQVIKYPTRGFVHVSLSPSGRNRKSLLISPQKNKYLPYT